MVGGKVPVVRQAHQPCAEGPKHDPPSFYYNVVFSCYQDSGSEAGMTLEFEKNYIYKKLYLRKFYVVDEFVVWNDVLAWVCGCCGCF